jgi:hypothetical protein
VRLHPGAGTRIRDRWSAPITEAVLRFVGPEWKAFTEVEVRDPVRGWIDVVLHAPARDLVVATEVEAGVRAIESQIRRGQDKAAALPSSDLWHWAARGGRPEIGRLLVLRSTPASREAARRFETLFRSAFPARIAALVAALRDAAPWPGAGILWATLEAGHATILERPPRGVTLGR